LHGIGDFEIVLACYILASLRGETGANNSILPNKLMPVLFPVFKCHKLSGVANELGDQKFQDPH
jgi:hypothetical protein